MLAYRYDEKKRAEPCFLFLFCDVFVRYSVGQAETVAHGGAEALDGQVHLLGRGGGVGGAEEELAQGLVRLGAEPGAAAQQHALVDAGIEDFLLDLERRAGAGVRVFGVVDLEPELGGREGKG